MKKYKIAVISLCPGFLLTGCGGNSGSTDTGAVVKPDNHISDVVLILQR